MVIRRNKLCLTERCDFCDMVIRRNKLCLTVQLIQPSSGTIYCMMHVSEICQTISLESQYLLYSYLENKSAKLHANTSGNHVVSCEYLINGLQGHPVYGLGSNGSFMLRFQNDVFAILRKLLRHFLNRKFKDPFERFIGLGHICFDLVVFWMSGYACRLCMTDKFPMPYFD